MSLKSNLVPLQIKAAGAAATLVGMYFTGHISRAYDRGEGDGSVPMLSSFLLFMCLSIMCVAQFALPRLLSMRFCSSKCFTMHVRNWVASAKIRLDEKRKARAAEEASDAAAAVVTAGLSPAVAEGAEGLRKRTGKTKKT
jgi:hypothetical protein